MDAVEPSGDDQRWIGIGRGDQPDTEAATRTAVTAALRGPRPKLLLAFAAISHDPQHLAAAIASLAPGVPAIGCSTFGEIGPGGPGDDGVVVFALGGDGFSVSTASAPKISGRQRDAGAELAACHAEVPDRGDTVLIVLTDGLARDQELLLRGVYGVLGATVPLVGGAAGNSWRALPTFQIHNGDVFNNGAVAACVSSTGPIGIGVAHGWRPTGEPMIVTHSADSRVYRLDDRPALDVYLERLGAPREIYDDADALRHYLLSRPLGLQRRSGVEVRNMSTKVDVAHRSIGGGGDLTEGMLAWAMVGDRQSVLDADERAWQAALSLLHGRDPIGVVPFNCAACRVVLGEDGIRAEGARMAAIAGPVPYAGFYTCGEIARTHGINGFHNQTSVVLAIG